MSDARYLIRRRWTDAHQAELKFPDKAELIKGVVGSLGDQYFSFDGGASTDLAKAWDDERGWSVEEQEWRDDKLPRVSVRGLVPALGPCRSLSWPMDVLWSTTRQPDARRRGGCRCRDSAYGGRVQGAREFLDGAALAVRRPDTVQAQSFPLRAVLG